MKQDDEGDELINKIYSQPPSLVSAAAGSSSESVDWEVPPPLTLASQNSFDSYSSSQDAQDRIMRDEEEFNVYTKYSDEKLKIAKLIEATIVKMVAVGEITIVDFGCGNGNLLNHYLSFLKEIGYLITYYAIETKPAYIKEVTEILETIGIVKYHVINEDCFSDKIYFHLPKNPDFILASHIGYFGNSKALINNIKNYMEDNTLAMFVHQAKGSAVTKLRETFSSRVETDVPFIIQETLHDLPLEELFIPSASSFNAQYASFPLEFIKKRYSEHKEGVSQDMASETEFLLQKNKESLRKMHRSEECAQALRSVITCDNKIIIWNHIQVCCKDREHLGKLTALFHQFSWGYNGDLPYIYHAIKEANLAQLDQILAKCRNEIAECNFLGVGLLTALVVSSLKFINNDALERYILVAEKLIATGNISSRELNNAIECCALFSHHTLGNNLRKYSSYKPTSHFSIGQMMRLSQEEWVNKLELLQENFSTLFHNHSPYLKSLERYATDHDLDKVLAWLTKNTVIAEKQPISIKRERSISPSR